VKKFLVYNTDRRLKAKQVQCMFDWHFIRSLDVTHCGSYFAEWYIFNLNITFSLAKLVTESTIQDCPAVISKV
jgi:hypothetical protein